MDLVTTRFYLFVGFTFVKPQAFPGGKSLFTDITWNAYSFQMIGLNVSFYMMGKSFLATHFANPCYCPLFTFKYHLLAFLHHWLDFLIKRLEVGTWLIWNCCYGRSAAGNIALEVLVEGCWFRWQISVFLNCFRTLSFFVLLDQITWCLVCQTLQLNLLSNGKERIQILLENSCLPKVEEIKDWHQVLWLKSPEVD